jgi:hypothetical protein
MDLRSPAKGVVFAASDVFFYAAPKLFYGVFAAMFNVSANLYIARGPTPTELDAYDAQVSLFGGPSACLSAQDFSPEAGRLQDLKHADHAAQLLTKYTIGRMAVSSTVVSRRCGSQKTLGISAASNRAEADAMTAVADAAILGAPPARSRRRLVASPPLPKSKGDLRPQSVRERPKKPRKRRVDAFSEPAGGWWLRPRFIAR